MSSRARNIVLFFLVLVIICLLIFNHLVSRFGLFWKSEKSLPKEPLSLPVLSSPLEKDLFEVSSASAADSDHLTFFLEEKVPVLAIFDGEVSLIDKGEEFSNIQIKSEKGVTASYIFTGEVLVEKGDKIAAGQKIGLVDPTQKGIGCLGGGNLGVYLLDEEGGVRLTREMIKAQ